MTLKSSLSKNNPDRQENGQGGLKAFSLWRLTLKSIKRHIWLPILALLGFVLAMPVCSALAINNFTNWYFDEDPAQMFSYYTDWAGDLVVMWQMLSACIIVVGAIMAVLVMFRYLHVRAQVDFYHSLPVRREQFFAANLLAAFLVFLAPYLLATLLNLLVLGVSGWTAYVNMGLYLQFVLFNIVVYVLFMACACLAMQLSGTMPSALKILVMTFGLAPLLAGMYELLGGVFFDTWVSMFSSASIVLLKASVVERYFMLSAMARGDWWSSEHIAQIICWQDWLAAIILAAAMLAISLFLYRRRRSEAAGSTLAFGWQKPFYKYPLVICSGIMLGVFFYLAGESSILWLYFGAILGAMFMALLLEVFIKSDFKAVKKGWRSAAVASVAVCLLLSAYAFDWTGFDRRQPAADKVEMVSVYSSNLMTIAGDYYYSDYWGDDYSGNYWTLNRKDMLSTYNQHTFSDPQNVAAVLAMVDNAQNTPSSLAYDSYEYGWPYVSDNLRVFYKLKNGSWQARSYWTVNCLSEDYQQACETILASDEWRRQLVINRLDLEHTAVCSLDSYMFGNNEYLYLQDLKSEDDWQQLLQTLRRDYAKLTAEDLLYSSPVGNLELGEYKERVYNPNNGSYDYSGMSRYDIRIFPGMEDTIALLNQVTDNMLTANFDLSNVVELREYRRWTAADEDALKENGAPQITAETAHTSNGDRLIATYRPETDAAKIAEILQNTVTSDAFWHTGLFGDNMVDTYYEVNYKNVVTWENGDEEIELNIIDLYPKPSRSYYESFIKN